MSKPLVVECRSCFARVVAVASEYCIHCQICIHDDLGREEEWDPVTRRASNMRWVGEMGRTGGNYPKLALIPILCKSIHA